jgi:hypothetical protein
MNYYYLGVVETGCYKISGGTAVLIQESWRDSQDNVMAEKEERYGGVA